VENDNFEMKKAYLCFHQGWTDIVCFLPQINYYCQFYDHLIVFFREEARDLVTFYTRDMEKVTPVFLKTDNGAHLFQYRHPSFIEDYDYLFHGQYEIMRKDEYKYACRKNTAEMQAGRGGYDFFVESFYELYGIPHSARVDYFEFTRDYALEEKRYNEFIKEHGENYILCHYDNNNSQHGPLFRSNTHLDIKSDKHEVVNLNKMSNIFFDFIKIISHAKEIHVVDSVWGVFIYQLDAKYSILQGAPVNAYCNRGQPGRDDKIMRKMFNSPIKLPNWNIIGP